MNRDAKPLDPFYPIFDHCDWLARLLPLGIKLVQLRIKDKPECFIREQIAAAKKLTDTAHCQLIVNDYWQLALELGCDFVHLGQEDLEGADITKLQSAGVRIGISTHCEDELDAALELDPDYIALGPVYPTILKKMAFDPQGLERVAEWKARIGSLPLVAIGGINLDRAPGVFAAGADIVSMVTDITLSSDPQAQTKNWMANTSIYRQPQLGANQYPFINQN